MLPLRRRTPLVLLAVLPLVGIAGAAGAAGRDFDHPASHDSSQQFAAGNVQRQDTPNDPGYDSAEPDDQDGRSSDNFYDERYDLFGFPSALTPQAVYRDGPNAGKPMISGFNAAGAWKKSQGRPDVVVAILDTGIKWDKQELRRQVHLNTAELPKPELADGTVAASYDADGDGAVTVDDYANDPRVGRSKPTGRDLIGVFSDHTDADHNGFVDDIAGWDFFDDDNDPTDASSYFAAGNHGSGRAADAVEQGNDGSGGLGVCPQCQFVPIRTWDTFVSDGNTFGMGILYAADNGVAVIEGANGSLYHSAFTEAAVDYAWSKNVVMTFSGDDLNTGNHNYPSNYNHVLLIQGTVPDTDGLGQSNEITSQFTQRFPQVPVGANLPVGTYFRGAGTTQYGGHSSISMNGSTGSQNTGKAAGAAALVISAARDAGRSLTADEVREVLEQTAEDVTMANGLGVGNPDYATTGWDPHFGWGRADLGKAAALAAGGHLPPEAVISSPDWFAPVTGSSVAIKGMARATHADGFHWKLEWGAGETPSTWTVAHEGDATGTVTDFGSIDLATVRAAVAAYKRPVDLGAPVFSPTAPDPFQQEFSLRLTVTAAGADVAGIDRKVLTAIDDPTLLAGFPKRLGAGGEAPIRYADIDGDNVQELVVPSMDGLVHAYRKDGSELAGFPVRTQLMHQAESHGDAAGFAALGAVSPALEAPRAPIVADLDGDGRMEVLTAAGTHLYVWESDGTLRPGFPVEMDRSHCVPALQSQPLKHPKCGFLASPSVGWLEGHSAGLDIVQPGLDGYLYAWRADGSPLPGYPHQVVDTALPANQRMIAEQINPAALADLDGDGADDVLVATNEAYATQSPTPEDLNGGIAAGLADILANAAGSSSRVYLLHGKTGVPFDGWPIKLNGAIQTTLPFIGPGQDPSVLTLDGKRLLLVSTTGGAVSEYGVDGKLVRSMQQSVFGPGSDATDRTGVINLFESASVGDLLGTGRPSVVKYGLTLSAVVNLLLVGQNVPYNHLIGGYDAGTGAPLPAFPRITDDFQFLSASTIAKVDPTSPANQVLAGTGLGLLHAYDGLTGRDAPGFPKVTGGWLFAPAAFSDDGRMADITREGYLFQWDMPKLPACQT
ncbi:MAG: cell wall-associated protease, partial [Frankiaceae bacterium]|nr:cell wall-associated protease [Frankiaceae bacterium]